MSYSGSNTESNVYGRYKLYNTNKYNSNNNDSIQLEVIIRELTFHPTCWCGILNISHTISFLFSQCPFELDTGIKENFESFLFYLNRPTEQRTEQT